MLKHDGAGVSNPTERSTIDGGHCDDADVEGTCYLLSTVCPYCGNDTGIERELDPQFGPASVDELETLVRNEWRRRLGPSSYRRDHSRTIIRAFVVYSLAPESPVRRAVVQQLIWREVTMLGTWGFSRADVEHEFGELAGAIRDVLTAVDFDPDGAATWSRRIQQYVCETLDWPRPISLESAGP